MGRLAVTGLVSFLATAALGCGPESAAGVLGTGGSGEGGTASSGSSGGAGATSTSTTTTTVTSTTATSTTSAGGTGGGSSDCDPPAPPGSLWALSDVDLDANTVSMCKYRGDVLLIVNTAEA